MTRKLSVSKVKRLLPFLNYFSSKEYWENRYRTGGNSGQGSYSHLAEFKSAVLNEFVLLNKVASVIEFGCGDGNQLMLATYPKYTGYDVSSTALDLCRTKFRDDSTKEFALMSAYDGRRADLAISLDVIFHLIEDQVFEEYMQRLFGSSSQFVIIYSSNQDEPIAPTSIHVKHRRFSTWVEENAACWKLVETVPNIYPYNGDSCTTSFADFYIYRKP